MIAYNSNEGSLHTGIVWFFWYAADSAHALGQLVSIDYSDATPDVAFTYDRLGRQLTVTDVLGTRTNEYSATSLLAEHLPDGTTLTRAYDDFGRASGIALGPDYAVSYGYDEYGRFSTVSVTNGPTFAYSYLPSTALLTGYTNDLGLSVAYAYDPLRDHKTLVSNAWSTNPISTFAYTYDAIGRRTRRIDDGTTTNLFGYNLRSELVSAEMGTNTYSYAYDPIGNRTSASENGLTTTYAANELNQYTALNPNTPNSTAFAYDADGNMTQYGDLSFYWDAENRLIGATSNGNFLVTNRYDFMSRRIEKATSTETNAFVYDGWNLLRETISSSSASTTNHYVWGLDLSGTIQGAGGIGGLLMQCHSDTNFPWFSFCDANGNISNLLDEAGSLAAHYEYDSYGNATIQSGTPSAANPFRFSSKYCDIATELLYYGHRFYSLNLGRWLSRDPLAHAFPSSVSHELQVLSFVENAPINKWDIFGLMCPRRQGVGGRVVDCDYACKKNLQRPFVAASEPFGHTICFQGQKCVCLYPTNAPFEIPIGSLAWRCLKAHEEAHRDDPQTPDCPPYDCNNPDRIENPTNLSLELSAPIPSRDQLECHAYRESLKCLDNPNNSESEKHSLPWRCYRRHTRLKMIEHHCADVPAPVDEPSGRDCGE